MCPERSTVFALCAVIAILFLLSGGVAASEHSASPEWSDQVFDDVEEIVAEYNAQADDEVGLLEGWVLGNDRINLHVRDAEGARAVYSLRLDEQQQVTAVSDEPFENPTVRLRTTKRVVEGIPAGDRTETAIKQAIWNDRIRLERVLYLTPGTAIFIGGRDLIIGGGIMAVSLTVLNFVGIKSVSSVLATIKKTVLAALGSLWEGLGGIATLLTVLESWICWKNYRHRSINCGR
ncbi:MAG: hypothetical protein A07HR67_02834 [uncultured archaeon A07HR67]|nr:MAG: hypothetical protein A07HR67_02834 [uncultured archaeon A07HR67]